VVPGEKESLAAYMIERGGHIVGLHAGGRLPLCQYLAVHTPLTTFKRYTQGVAHRVPPPATKSSALGFTAQLVADFDIVATPAAAITVNPSGSGKLVAAAVEQVRPYVCIYVCIHTFLYI